MTWDSYVTVFGASPGERRDVFAAASQRLGMRPELIEKDFWVCATLELLYHCRPEGAPRLLFKGGTSLSKSYSLIQRFSEDIDITVFRQDLGHALDIEKLGSLSKSGRRKVLDALKTACRAYIVDTLRPQLADLMSGLAKVVVDPEDPDGQSLRIVYPRADADAPEEVLPAIRIESGARSALNPNCLTSVAPYAGEVVPNLDLVVKGITTIVPARTFWDKCIIVHEVRSWYDHRGLLRGGGNRISRHYYDLHRLFNSSQSATFLAESDLGLDCVRHATQFFSSPDFDLSMAMDGNFSLSPSPEMIPDLRRDYDRTRAMFFGSPPAFDEVMSVMATLEHRINQVARTWSASHTVL